MAQDDTVAPNGHAHPNPDLATETDYPPPRCNAFPIVGIGASAGGLGGSARRMFSWIGTKSSAMMTRSRFGSVPVSIDNATFFITLLALSERNRPLYDAIGCVAEFEDQTSHKRKSGSVALVHEIEQSGANFVDARFRCRTARIA